MKWKAVIPLVLLFIQAGISAPAPVAHRLDVRSLGARGDGVTFDTEAIQRAIDSCAGTGGTVLLPPGTYLTKPLELRGKMTLRLEKGAVLLGSPQIADYPRRLPEGFPVKELCRSLLYAADVEGLTIEGGGEINGNCLKMNIDGYVRKVGKEALRPSLLRVFRSTRVTVRDVTFRAPCMWTTIFSGCDDLLIEHVAVDAPPDCGNLSGFEISDCHRVTVRDCDVRCEDDGICFKTFPRWGVTSGDKTGSPSLRPENRGIQLGAAADGGMGRGLKDVVVEGNTVLSYRANAIKLGFWTYGPVENLSIRNNKVLGAKYAGLSLASVHGAPVRNIVVDGLDMDHVGQPLFIRLGNMTGVAPGSLEGLTLANLHVRSVDPGNGPACVISGIPGARIRSVLIRDSSFVMPGGLSGTPAMPREKENLTPQSNMFWNTPGYAFFVRHADGVEMRNVTLSKEAPDVRPWLFATDAEVMTKDCRESPSASRP